MFWDWLYSRCDFVFSPVKAYAHSHMLNAFRLLLFAGDVLLFAILLSVFITRSNPGYAAWVAGLAMILSFLFLCALVSTRLSGCQRYRDRWLKLATETMVLVGVIAGVGVFVLK